jgi:hypothetical protein
VLDKLDACKMTSTRNRDRFFRFLKRGALEKEVQKCGADIRRSFETFKVCALILAFIDSDGFGRLRFKLMVHSHSETYKRL